MLYNDVVDKVIAVMLLSMAAGSLVLAILICSVLTRDGPRSAIAFISRPTNQRPEGNNFWMAIFI
jgi:hypothetical protein